MGWLEKWAILVHLIANGQERVVDKVNVKDSTDIFTGTVGLLPREGRYVAAIPLVKNAIDFS